MSTTSKAPKAEQSKGGRRRTDPHLRTVILLALLLGAGWCWFTGSWTAAVAIGVLAAVALLQWWNERSKRT
jgi:hypothetical protein